MILAPYAAGSPSKSPNLPPSSNLLQGGPGPQILAGLLTTQQSQSAMAPPALLGPSFNRPLLPMSPAFIPTSSTAPSISQQKFIGGGGGAAPPSAYQEGSNVLGPMQPNQQSATMSGYPVSGHTVPVFNPGGYMPPLMGEGVLYQQGGGGVNHPPLNITAFLPQGALVNPPYRPLLPPDSVNLSSLN